jgi:hypothetical protein
MTWITHLPQRLSDRVHARGDAFAEQAGWTTTTTAGRFGFGTRVYRDPRFGQRQAEAARAGLRAPRPGAVHQPVRGARR